MTTSLTDVNRRWELVAALRAEGGGSAYAGTGTSGGSGATAGVGRRVLVQRCSIVMRSV
ncbi:MAG TPA: hypothetical protein VFW14_20095 [Gaiellales bacterium]|nr:hypothetical protein [Gaiellales bacterium]